MAAPTPKDDPMVRDRKTLPNSRLGAVLPGFLVSALVVVPVWLLVLLPSTLVWNLVAKAVGANKKKARPTPPAIDTSVAVPPSRESREFDIVLFGVTGFTGALAAKYIAKQYGTRIKWAIAGRREAALEDLRAQLAKVDVALESLPILVADTSKPDSIVELVKRTRSVATTVGPFAKYGIPLVEACAAYGTAYCDITGETDFVRECIDRFDDLAKQTGAQIVHHCGHDCVPWDLMAVMLAKKLKEECGEELAEVHFYDYLKGSASGGTMATVFHALSTKRYRPQLAFDPLVKTIAGERSGCETKAANQSFLGYSSEIGKWVGPFIMASVMANSVKRTNAVCQLGPKITYKEALVYPSFMAGFVNMTRSIVLGTALFFPPLGHLMQTYVLPKPGEGPSEANMDRSFLKIMGYATGTNGSKRAAMIYFPTDPGYRDTARMLVESALTLVLDADKADFPAGVYTPGCCQGEPLLHRLQATGTTFEFLE